MWNNKPDEREYRSNQLVTDPTHKIQATSLVYLSLADVEDTDDIGGGSVETKLALLELCQMSLATQLGLMA